MAELVDAHDSKSCTVRCAGSIPASGTKPRAFVRGFFIMWTVYVLRSLKSGKHYVGMSQDVKRRLMEHNSGKSKFTSGHMPWKIIYCEEFSNSMEAREREKYFKSAAGKKYLQQKVQAGSLPD